MFGQNVMKSMTKEDAIQISNARKFLVPLSHFRDMNKLKPKLNDMSKVSEDTEIHAEILKLRLEEIKKDEDLCNHMIRTTLSDVIKNNKNKSKKILHAKNF
jgi:hypothetical protein